MGSEMCIRDSTSFRKCGLRETVIFADRLLQSGFRLATNAGISVAIDDMLIPSSKERIISEASAKVKEYDKQFMSGLVTNQERYTTWLIFGVQLVTKLVKR